MRSRFRKLREGLLSGAPTFRKLREGLLSGALTGLLSGALTAY
jgi:hypothetical protein